MRKIKRLISFLLCLTLTAALALSASAAQYTDEDEIGELYAPAVSEMSRLGVLNGFPDGSFQPTKETKKIPLDPENPKRFAVIGANLDSK